MFFVSTVIALRDPLKSHVYFGWNIYSEVPIFLVPGLRLGLHDHLQESDSFCDPSFVLDGTSHVYHA